MNWIIDFVLPLIKTYGPEGIKLARKLYTKWKTGGEPTDAEWDELEQLGKQTPTSMMQKLLIQNNIDPESEKGKALLELVKQ